MKWNPSIVLTIRSVALLSALSINVAAADTNPASTWTNSSFYKTLTVQIDSPTDGAVIPPGRIPLRAHASLTGPDAAVLYVIDISSATASALAENCPQRGQGVLLIQCESEAALALNHSLVRRGNVDAGITIFSDAAQTLPFNPDGLFSPYFDDVAADRDHDGIPDIENELTGLQGDSESANFDAALLETLARLSDGRPQNEQHLAYFISPGITDHFSTGPDSPLDRAARAGIVINTYAIGTNGKGCNAGMALRQIADATHGTCTAIDHVSSLSTVLPPPATPYVQLAGGYVDVLHNDYRSSQSIQFDERGRFTGPIFLEPGNSSVNVIAFASDGTGIAATINVIGADTTPDGFHFAPQFDVHKDTLIASAPVTVTGINAPARISVDGGRYSIDGGPFTTQPGQVAPNAQIRAQVRSSATPGEHTQAVVTVGGFVARFEVSTIIDATPDVFDFVDRIVALPLPQNYTSNTVTITGINVPASIQVSGGTGAAYSINGGPFVSTPGQVSRNDTVTLRNRGVVGGRSTMTATIGTVSDSWTIGRR